MLLKIIFPSKRRNYVVKTNDSGGKKKSICTFNFRIYLHLLVNSFNLI